MNRQGKDVLLTAAVPNILSVDSQTKSDCACAAAPDLNRFDEDDWDTVDEFLALEHRSAETDRFIAVQNAKTIAALGGSRLNTLCAELKARYGDAHRLIYPYRRGQYAYEIHRGLEHPKGLLRRMPAAAVGTTDLAWEPVLDIDKLSGEEQKDWVFGGCISCPPDHKTALIKLSAGGADAQTLREFDLELKTFVADGFIVPLARGTATWFDDSALLVMSAAAGGAVTSSGYPRSVRIWRRGHPLRRAEVIFEIGADDLAAAAGVVRCEGQMLLVLRRLITMENSTFLIGFPDGTRTPLDLPIDASVQFAGDYVLLCTRSPCRIGGSDFPADAVLVGRLREIVDGRSNFHVLFVPHSTAHIEGATIDRDSVTMKILDDLTVRLATCSLTDGRWEILPVEGVKASGNADIWPSAYSDDDWYVPRDTEAGPSFVSADDNLTPRTLYILESSRARPWMSDPELFNANGLAITRHRAVSQDGTWIPYFLVAPKEMPLDGCNPTIVYAYGSWQISNLPAYQIDSGALWLERQCVYVLANVRGGGELGRAWHEAARRKTKIRAVHDLIAVACDLIEKGITSPAHLGCRGISAGGHLVATAALHAPGLFRAVSALLPVLDKKRYSKLLVGQSWIAEYGDPDDPDDVPFLRKISPYHIIPNSGAVPEFLLYTSSSDDRVHPGHARKMAARLEKKGHRVLFYEAQSGGHGFGNDVAERALIGALEFAFFSTRLGPHPPQILNNCGN